MWLGVDDVWGRIIYVIDKAITRVHTIYTCISPQIEGISSIDLSEGQASSIRKDFHGQDAPT